jgi:DNA-binding IclR family transcriptional regulator
MVLDFYSATDSVSAVGKCFQTGNVYRNIKMNMALDRGLSILEHLTHHPQGLPLSLLASELDIPLGACHRLLADLQHRGYVRQARKQADYVLTTKMVSLGLGFLSSAGIVDVAEPLLERLSQRSGELVRLSIVDDDRLTWVAKSQGMRQTGLRYDPDMGMDARLSCTASGHAWLMTLSDLARLFACSTRARLRHDRRGLRSRDVRPGGTRVSPQGSDRRDQHCGSPLTFEQRENARTGQCAAGVSC